MRLFLAPAALVVLSIALVAALVVFAPDEDGVVVVATFVASIVGFFVGVDWWILRLGRAPVADGAQVRRVAGILALAAPATLWTVGGFVVIVSEGDNAWLALPLVLAPGLLVWPFVIAAVRRVRVAAVVDQGIGR